MNKEAVVPTTVPSPQEVANARTRAGGWTKATLAQWGVPWPPPKGWRRRLAELYESGDRHAATESVDADLAALAQLAARGILSQDEYMRAKQRLLNA